MRFIQSPIILSLFLSIFVMPIAATAKTGPDIFTSAFYQYRIETSRGRFINEIDIARQLGRTPNFREKEFIQFCREEIKK